MKRTTSIQTVRQCLERLRELSSEPADEVTFAAIHRTLIDLRDADDAHVNTFGDLILSEPLDYAMGIVRRWGVDWGHWPWFWRMNSSNPLLWTTLTLRAESCFSAWQDALEPKDPSPQWRSLVLGLRCGLTSSARVPVDIEGDRALLATMEFIDLSWISWINAGGDRREGDAARHLTLFLLRGVPDKLHDDLFRPLASGPGQVRPSAPAPWNNTGGEPSICSLEDGAVHHFFGDLDDIEGLADDIGAEEMGAMKIMRERHDRQPLGRCLP